MLTGRDRSQPLSRKNQGIQIEHLQSCVDTLCTTKLFIGSQGLEVGVGESSGSLGCDESTV